MGKSVTYVSGMKCYPCLGLHTKNVKADLQVGFFIFGVEWDEGLGFGVLKGPAVPVNPGFTRSAGCAKEREAPEGCAARSAAEGSGPDGPNKSRCLP